MTEGSDDSKQTPASASPDRSSSSQESYQRRRSSLSRKGRRSRRRSSPRDVMLAVRRAFSIDQGGYEAADSGDELYLDDNGYDDEQHLFPTSDGMEDSNGSEEGFTTKQCRWMGLAVFGVLLFLSVAIPSRAMRSKNSTVLFGDEEVCTDPILSTLRASSQLKGLKHGAVAADHPLCSQMGASIMQDLGGNAIDAAITTALCLGVANPASSGLGGGAFLLVHADPVADEKSSKFPVFHDERTGTAPVSESGKITEVIDCREVAPAAASTHMFDGLSDHASVKGGLSIGVPGELRGLELVHARHGKLAWKAVIEPVQKLARDGVPVNPNLAHEIAIMAKAALEHPDMLDDSLRALLTSRDDWRYPYKEGALLKNPKLADTLKAVMQDGSDALYSGKRAAGLAADVQATGGILTQDDLENYHASLRDPVFAHDVSGLSFVGPPPPSSGGAAIVGVLRFLSGYAKPFATFADTLSTHRMVEAFKHAFAMRMSLSDPAYNTETVEDAVVDMVSGGYMESLRLATNDTSTLGLSQYGGFKWSQVDDTDGSGTAKDAKEGDRRRHLREDRRGLLRHFGYLNDHGTTHFSIVDKDGNGVAMTSSVNTYFGSGIVSASTGLVLNNQMDDFATPGGANVFGLHPSKANYIQPGKKPLSSMSPTMVFETPSSSGDPRLGSLVLVIGASGGPKIITAVVNVVLRHLFMGGDLFEAIVHPRLHEQLIYHGAAVAAAEASTVGSLKMNVTQRTRQALMDRGQELLDVDYAGTVQAVAVDLETGELTATCDVRKGGSPAGY